MRLHPRDHAPGRALPRSGGHCAYFGRMMRIIVDDDCAVPFPNPCEAPLHSVEALEPLQDRLVAEPHLERDADCGERIPNIVTTRHRDFHALDHAALPITVED